MKLYIVKTKDVPLLSVEACESLQLVKRVDLVGTFDVSDFISQNTDFYLELLTPKVQLKWQYHFLCCPAISWMASCHGNFSRRRLVKDHNRRLLGGTVETIADICTWGKCAHQQVCGIVPQFPHAVGGSALPLYVVVCYRPEKNRTQQVM